MLRAAVILLFVANLLVLAWHRGWIPGAAQPVPRMDQQLHPERLSLLNPQAVTQLATLACVEIGPLTGEEPVRRAAAALTAAGIPSSAWQLQSMETAGTWALATIKMPSRDFRERKEDTYRSAKISFEPLQGFPDEQPTLVLSRHESEAAAQAALDAMTRRNYKGLRVLRVQAPQSQTTLRLRRVDGLQLSKLDAITSPPWGNARKTCAAEAPGAASAASAGSAASAAGSSASR